MQELGHEIPCTFHRPGGSSAEVQARVRPIIYGEPMQVTLHNDQMMVLDHVLPQDRFKALSSALKLEKYRWVHHGGWQKVWRLLDGAPLAGDLVHSHAVNCEGHVYPTGAEIDSVIDAVLGLADEIASLVGRQGREWATCSCRPYVYPLGAGLSWHVDEVRYTGSFIYYAHETWNANWGGELLVADATCRVKYPTVDLADPNARRMLETLHAGQIVDATYISSKLMETGCGQYVMPRPNRLVVLSAGNYHAIKRVDPSAGDHARVSVTGFFQSVPESSTVR